jgi:hypothetical protein
MNRSETPPKAAARIKASSTYFHERYRFVASYVLFLTDGFLLGPTGICSMSKVVPIGHICPQKNLPAKTAAANTTSPGRRYNAKDLVAKIVPRLMRGSRRRKKSTVNPS